MKKILNKLMFLLLLVVLALSLTAFQQATPAFQAPGDRLVLGDNYTLEAGETLDGNLIVLGGNATLEAGSRVEEDVVIMGGNLLVGGAIGGDINVIGGLVTLGEGAVVEGGVNSPGVHSPGEKTRGGRRLRRAGAWKLGVCSSVLQQAQGEAREVRRRALRGLGVEELARKVAELSGLGLEELRSGSRRRPVVEARRALAQVTVEELGKRGSTVVRYLGVANSTANRGLGYGEPSPLARRLLADIAKK